MPTQGSDQDRIYRQAAEIYGAALERLARAYEADAEVGATFLQEIHTGLWRSFEGFDQRCSLRTWICRVAHNVSTSHVLRQRRARLQNMVGLDELENLPGARVDNTDQRHALERLLVLVQKLKPLDRQVILSYLEGLDAAEIGEITGLKPGNVATKIYRIETVLARRFQGGVSNE
jgi:RNA polymerase sigma-70 factor (ECF subfamily)